MDSLNYDDLLSFASVLKSNNKDLREKNVVLESSLETLQEKLDESQEKLDESQEKLDETQEKLDETQEKLDETQEKLDETQEKLDETQALKDKLEKDLDIQDKEIDKFIEMINYVKEKDKLSKQLQKKRKEIIKEFGIGDLKVTELSQQIGYIGYIKREYNKKIKEYYTTKKVEKPELIPFEVWKQNNNISCAPIQYENQGLRYRTLINGVDYDTHYLI